MGQNDRYPGASDDEQDVLVLAQGHAVPVRPLDVDTEGFGSGEALIFQT